MHLDLLPVLEKVYCLRNVLKHVVRRMTSPLDDSDLASRS